jgi:hypothetical protein
VLLRGFSADKRLPTSQRRSPDAERSKAKGRHLWEWVVTMNPERFLSAVFGGNVGRREWTPDGMNAPTYVAARRTSCVS